MTNVLDVLTALLLIVTIVMLTVMGYDVCTTPGLIRLPFVSRPYIGRLGNIPRCVFMCWRSRWVSVDHARICYDAWRTTNPDLCVMWFDDNACNDVMNRYVPERIRKAYYDLRPPAYRADLWRLCVLYLWGGIYADHSVVPLCNMNRFFTAPLTVVIDSAPNCIHNGFIIAAPRNAVLLQYIMRIVNNVERRAYGSSPLDVTGPKVFARVYPEAFIMDHQLQHQRGVRQLVVDSDNTPVLHKKPLFIAFLRAKLFDPTGYTRMWYTHTVFTHE